MTRGVSQLEQMEDGRDRLLPRLKPWVSLLLPSRFCCGAPPLSYGCMSRVGGPVKGEERRAGP